VGLELRRITANNLRKFRSPVTIDGLTDGLNILVELNSTGNSTWLEAIRAAFFAAPIEQSTDALVPAVQQECHP
jgi:predicted ATP-dependent endonuclease of OLD family